ncbi:2,3-butanediol dehydrogenase [[Eubacterium] cellulosolvens]
MKAAVWYGREDIRVVDFENSKPKLHEVKIAVKWSGICGSDLHEYQDGPIIIPHEPHPLTGVKAPVIMGHEFSGEIIELGEEVANWDLGDRVTVHSYYYCKNCYYCKKGEYELCEKMAFIGFATGTGSFAEEICAPAELLYKLPDDMSYEEGAFIEPLAIGIHAVRRGGVREGDTAAVIGAGPIGILTMQALIAAGVRAVYVIEVIKKRIRLAEKLGADRVLNPHEIDVKEKILELNDGVGTDFTFECVGSEAALKSAIDIVKKGGTIVVNGIFNRAPSIDMTQIVVSEKKIFGSTDGDYPAAISLLSKKRVDVESMISSKIKLGDIVEKGFRELISNKDHHMKILVTP